MVADQSLEMSRTRWGRFTTVLGPKGVDRGTHEVGAGCRRWPEPAYG